MASGNKRIIFSEGLARVFVISGRVLWENHSPAELGLGQLRSGKKVPQTSPENGTSLAVMQGRAGSKAHSRASEVGGITNRLWCTRGQFSRARSPADHESHLHYSTVTLQYFSTWGWWWCSPVGAILGCLTELLLTVSYVLALTSGFDLAAVNIPSWSDNLTFPALVF